MHLHIKSSRRKPTSAGYSWRQVGHSLKIASSLSIVVVFVLLLVSGSEAIVKQSSAQQQQQQQSRSDDSQAQASPQQSAHQQHQSAFNNHQSSAGASPQSISVAQSSPSSYSSSVSISSSNSASAGPVSQGSQNGPSQASRSDQLSGANAAYNNYASINNGPSSGPKSSGGYMDGLSAVANNPEHSYQAAAASVNMALANSGIYNSGYNSPQVSNGSPQNGLASASGSLGASHSAPSSSSQSQVSSSSPSASSSSSSVSAPQSLNPLHYFYYPPKESSSASQQAKVSPVDIMSNSASNNYQSLAYPSYADQLSSALSGLGSSGPEAQASNPDASYLPQPGVGLDGNASPSLYGSNNGPLGGPSSGAANQNQQYNGDINSYSSNGANGLPQSQGNQQAQHQSQQQQQQHNSPGAISFNGPSSNGPSNGDYLNSHLGPAGHQQMSPSNGYQGNSLYNQLGDLSTSNFGNNPGGLSSVASYMSPGQQVQAQHQIPQQGHQAAPNSAHDLFGASAASGLSQFNSAASQLAPAAVSPPVGGQQAGPGSSLFGSSLFGAGQQANGAGSGGLFSNQHYLSSFLSPQQYTQLTGQQLPSLDPQQQAQQSQPMASASSPSGAVASVGSSKRFGISSFIMPMLALAGLSLLIPTMSNIGTAVGRKKRSVEDKSSASSRQQSIAYESMNGAAQIAKEHSIGEYMDKIERYYSIYKNAVENDDCLNRLICEFGDTVKDITGKSAIVTVIEKLVPTWMTGKVHLFKEAALSNKEGKEKCKKYICHSSTRQH